MADRAGQQLGRGSAWRGFSGRIKPADADAVLVAAVTFLVAAMAAGDEEDRALALIARALPMSSSSTAMQPIVNAAVALDRAAGQRHRRGEAALAWHAAMFEARRVIAARAMARAMAAVD